MLTDLGTDEKGSVCTKLTSACVKVKDEAYAKNLLPACGPQPESAFCAIDSVPGWTLILLLTCIRQMQLPAKQKGIDTCIYCAAVKTLVTC